MELIIIKISGTGFKLGPVTGEMLADMALRKQTKFDRTPFRANRFKNKQYLTKTGKDNQVLSKI